MIIVHCACSLRTWCRTMMVASPLSLKPLADCHYFAKVLFSPKLSEVASHIHYTALHILAEALINLRSAP